VTRIIPAKAVVDMGLAPKYLDEDFISFPDLAFAAVRREMDRMARRVTLMLNEAFAAATEGPQERIDGLLELDDELDELYDQTVTYLGRVAQETLTKPHVRELRRLISVANNLESLGDLIEKELVELAQHRLDQGLTISESSLAVLGSLHSTVTDAIDHVIEAFSNDDEVAAEAVRKLKPQVRKLERDAIRHHTDRLTAPEPDRMELYRLETDLVEVYRRIYGMARRIAGYVSAANGDS
jgi:phosphate:Na+ symporter